MNIIDTIKSSPLYRSIFGVSNADHIVKQQAIQQQAITHTSAQIATAVKEEVNAVVAVAETAYARVSALLGTGAVGSSTTTGLMEARVLLAQVVAKVNAVA